MLLAVIMKLLSFLRKNISNLLCASQVTDIPSALRATLA